jgi:hypothetical protein
MRTLTGIMSQKSKIEYLESCRARYPSRNRVCRSAMIDEVSDALGWERKHTIKALNGHVSRGQGARKRVAGAAGAAAVAPAVAEFGRRGDAVELAGTALEDFFAVGGPRRFTPRS